MLQHPVEKGGDAWADLFACCHLKRDGGVRVIGDSANEGAIAVWVREFRCKHSRSCRARSERKAPIDCGGGRLEGQYWEDGIDAGDVVFKCNGLTMASAN